MKSINILELINKEFNDWKVVSAYKKDRKIICKCICKCGTEKDIQLSALKSGNRKRCRKCDGKNRTIKDKTGQIFGKIKVLKLLTKDVGHLSIYLCECECGNQIEVKTRALTPKGIKTCLQCLHRKYIGKLSGQHYNRIIKAANSRGYNINIAQTDMWKLFEDQKGICALTGLELKFAHNGYKRSDTSASLDRIDNNKGYIENNVQWVHKTINKMKNILSEEEFVYYCKLVADYDNKKKQLAVASDIQEDEWVKWL